jgi:hypothetical protein
MVWKVNKLEPIGSLIITVVEKSGVWINIPLDWVIDALKVILCAVTNNIGVAKFRGFFSALI